MNYALRYGTALTEANLLLVSFLGSSAPISSFNNYQHVTFVDQDVNRFGDNDMAASRSKQPTALPEDGTEPPRFLKKTRRRTMKATAG